MEKIEYLKQLIDQVLTQSTTRAKNLQRLRELYEDLGISQKVPAFEELFTFNAINLAGLSLQKETLLHPQPKRYVQIIGIKKVENRSKNVNIRYFGKSENLEEEVIRNIAEFVLRWRLEKGYIAVDNYQELLGELESKEVEPALQGA